MATYSFELYPPRTPAAELALYDSLDNLVGAAPEFISVTYGASGSTRDASLGVLRHLLSTAVPPMAHLTCVGWTYADATRVIREFLDAGLTSFLALRGDPPAGSSEGDDFLGDLTSAGELVQLIHRVQEERVPFLQEPVRGFPGAARIRSGEKVTIAVAAFPNGHPRSRSVEQDLDTLLAKEAAGANLAITQLVFEADDYLRFVDQARAAGVTMRILPGVMPILSARRLHRMIDLTGERMPKALLARLEAAGSDEKQHAVGMEHAVGMSRELLNGGASGLHLYTFNKHQAVLALLEELELFSPANPTPQTTPSQFKEHA